MKAMTSANSATASVSAKPSSTLPNTRGAASGLRSAPETKLPKMLPMPTPTPARAMVARPAPMSLAAEASMEISFRVSSRVEEKAPPSVTQVDGVVEIQAGQDREDIGLQESDQQFEAGEGDDEGKRRPAGPDAQHDDEAAEHLQHGVAGQHVGEQADRQAERAHEVGDDLDRHQQEQQHEGHALRDKERHEVHAVLDEADRGDAQEHDKRHREGDDDVAGRREGVGHQAQDIAEQNEDEQRQDEREVLLARVADIVAHHAGDELVAHLGDRLQAARHQRLLAHADHEDDGG